MSHFEVFAHGDSFDPDAYLSATTLTIDHKWHKGQYGRNHPKTAGVSIRLGDGRTLGHEEQQRIAADFLVANRNALKHLAAFPGVWAFILGLEFHMDMAPNITGMSIGVSPQLAWHALDVGIQLVLYLQFHHINIDDE